MSDVNLQKSSPTLHNNDPPVRTNGRPGNSNRPAGSNNRPADPSQLDVAEAALPSSGLPRRALITGGAGFVGTNVAAHLASEGCEVVVFDSLARPGVQDNLNWLRTTFDGQIKFVKADVRDASAVRRAVSNCDAVFHFAAQVAVTTSLCDPRMDFEVNAQGTLNVLDACRRLAQPPPLLFTSTNKVYGDLQNLPLKRVGERYAPVDDDLAATGIDEAWPLEFHSPYGCSKGAADQYVLDYARCWDLPATVFRMSCIYGPHQWGTEDQGWVAHFVRQALEDKPIVLYGDGRQVRDLLFAEDLVDAMTAAVRNIDRTRGRAFNIGGGPRNAVSLRDVIDQIAELHGRRPVVRRSAWRQGDQRYYVSDHRRLFESIGWLPSVTVERGIRRLYYWLQRRPAPFAKAV